MRRNGGGRLACFPKHVGLGRGGAGSVHLGPLLPWFCFLSLRRDLVPPGLGKSWKAAPLFFWQWQERTEGRHQFSKQKRDASLATEFVKSQKERFRRDAGGADREKQREAASGCPGCSQRCPRHQPGILFTSACSSHTTTGRLLW